MWVTVLTYISPGDGPYGSKYVAIYTEQMVLFIIKTVVCTVLLPGTKLTKRKTSSVESEECWPNVTL